MEYMIIEKIDNLYLLTNKEIKTLIKLNNQFIIRVGGNSKNIIKYYSDSTKDKNIEKILVNFNYLLDDGYEGKIETFLIINYELPEKIADKLFK